MAPWGQTVAQLESVSCNETGALTGVACPQFVPLSTTRLPTACAFSLVKTVPAPPFWTPTPTTRGSRPGKVVGTGINRYAPASASTLPVTDATLGADGPAAGQRAHREVNTAP